MLHFKTWRKSMTRGSYCLRYGGILEGGDHFIMLCNKQKSRRAEYRDQIISPPPPGGQRVDGTQ